MLKTQTRDYNLFNFVIDFMNLKNRIFFIILAKHLLGFNQLLSAYTTSSQWQYEEIGWNKVKVILKKVNIVQKVIQYE